MKKTVLVAVGLLAITSISINAQDAKALWDKNCIQCHGKEGKADTKMGEKLNAKNLTDPKVQASFTDADAAKSIKEGMKENGKTVMKAFGDKLSDADIKALVTYVRSLKK
jgi:mono/diheme cytochrome c family protein